MPRWVKSASVAALALYSTLFAFTSVKADKPVLSLVIDDLGYSYESAREALNLPGQHTFAIIPKTTYSRKIAYEAYQDGREIILHMPMQSSLDNPIEDSALHDRMSEDEITENVQRMIAELPHISGINNHMGSHLTQKSYIMRPVMETIQAVKQSKPLYFLDSRTTPLSSAYHEAVLAGIPSLKRDIFLDIEPSNEAATRFQLNRWLKKASINGSAIAIGHPHQVTLAVLRQKIPELSMDFEFKTLSQLIQIQAEEFQSWPKYLSHLQKDLKNSKQSP